MLYHLKTNETSDRFILSVSNYAFNHAKPTPIPNVSIPPTPIPRSTSEIGSDSYRRSLRRAFARSKLLAYFNPDLTQFITLTYKDNMQDPQQAIYDFKQLVKQHNRNTNQINKVNYSHSPSAPEPSTNSEQHVSADLSTYPQVSMSAPDPVALPAFLFSTPCDSSTCGSCGLIGKACACLKRSERKANEGVHRYKDKPFKYIYVMEVQKRGAIHFHIVCNDALELVKNKNGYNSVKHWKHGFSSVLSISNVDNNFKPYLYLFKYMGKAQRVGKSFVHTSKNFDKIKTVEYADYITALERSNLAYKEDYDLTINERDCKISKLYYKAKEM